MEHELRIRGLRLHVREAGDGPPLLLLNGIGAHVGMWRPLEATLPDVRVISYDAPGTGRSETPLLPLTIPALAGLAEGVLDALGCEQVDVLGYSFGGIVAQHLARRAPERTRRLVLAATTPGWGGVAGSLATMTHMATPLRYYSRSYYDATIGDIAGGRARSDPEWIERHAEERQAHPPSPLGYAWQLAALTVPPGSLPWLHELRHATLVLPATTTRSCRSPTHCCSRTGSRTRGCCSRRGRDTCCCSTPTAPPIRRSATSSAATSWTARMPAPAASTSTRRWSSRRCARSAARCIPSRC